jgi:hypothetical protein
MNDNDSTRYHATSESLCNYTNSREDARALAQEGKVTRPEKTTLNAGGSKVKGKDASKAFHSLIAIKAISRLVYQVRKLQH